MRVSFKKLEKKAVKERHSRVGLGRFGLGRVGLGRVGLVPAGSGRAGPSRISGRSLRRSKRRYASCLSPPLANQ